MAPFIGTGIGASTAPWVTVRYSSSPSSRRAREVALTTRLRAPVTSSRACGQRLQQALGPGGVGLQHQGVAEAVGDDAGQAVALGVDQAVEGRIEQGLAQGQGMADARGEPVRADLRLRVGVDQPCGDGAGRVEGGEAERAVALDQPDQGAGGEVLGAPVHGDFVGEGPGRALGQRRPLPGRSFTVGRSVRLAVIGGSRRSAPASAVW